MTVVETTRRRDVAVQSHGDVEMVELGGLLNGLGVTLATDAAAGTGSLSYQGREVGLFHKKSLASVNGDLRLLSSPVWLESGHWYVPLDAVSRLLGPLLGVSVTWRPAQRALLIGPVRLPRVSVSTYVGADTARVVFQSTDRVSFQVSQGSGRVSVSVPNELIDTGLQRERVTGGIVELVEFQGGRDQVFNVVLGPRFQQFRASEQDAPPRLILEFQAAPVATRPTPAATPAAATAPKAPAAAAAEAPVIVIDPGHGGDEVGAQGPGGTLEKDVTLALARKLRSSLANRLGLQAFLTRDKDQALSLDERAAIANNYKAAIFVSIHANASRSHGARGSEVYFLAYQATDDESRRIAAAEGGIESTGTTANGVPDLALVLWDMAQADHLEESSVLASRIQEELAGVTGSEGRGVKQAPFRVLVGAAMPAVLVEVAFISNPEEEKLLTSDAYQNKVVTAIVQGVAQYERDRARRLGLQPSEWHPGS